MKPISNDLRRRIIEAIQENEESQPEIAERFSVSLSTVEKLWHRFRLTGSYEPLPHAGGRTRLLEADEEFVRAEVAAQPDITLAELSTKVASEKNQVPVSLSTLSEELRRLGLPRKKNDLRRRARFGASAGKTRRIWSGNGLGNPRAAEVFGRGGQQPSDDAPLRTSRTGRARV